MANLEAKFGAMSDEELQNHFAFVNSILPGGNEEARAKLIESKLRDFKKNDLNSDETIQPGAEFEGLADYFFNRYGVEKTEENFKKYFTEIDVDGDGNITFKEFIDYVDSLAVNYGIPAM